MAKKETIKRKVTKKNKKAEPVKAKKVVKEVSPVVETPAKETKKVEKKETKKKVVKKEKTHKVSLLKRVKEELIKTTWPTVGNIVKYTFATIIMVLILTGFFALLNLVLSFVKGAFN